MRNLPAQSELRKKKKNIEKEETERDNSTCLRGGFWLVSIMLVQSEEATGSSTYIPHFHFTVCTLQEIKGIHFISHIRGT